MSKASFAPCRHAVRSAVEHLELRVDRLDGFMGGFQECGVFGGLRLPPEGLIWLVPHFPVWAFRAVARDQLADVLLPFLQFAEIPPFDAAGQNGQDFNVPLSGLGVHRVEVAEVPLALRVFHAPPVEIGADEADAEPVDDLEVFRHELVLAGTAHMRNDAVGVLQRFLRREYRRGGGERENQSDCSFHGSVPYFSGCSGIRVRSPKLRGSTV